MSWDVCIVKFENVYENVEDVSNDDAEPLVLGSVEEIHRAISDVFTETDWSDSAWGVWDGDDGSIEFNLGDGAETNSLMLHVRAGDSVAAGIVELAKRNGWQAIDTSKYVFLERQEIPEAGLQGWRAYRDRVIGNRKDGNS